MSQSGRKRDDIWDFFVEVNATGKLKSKRAMCKRCNLEMSALVNRMKNHIYNQCLKHESFSTEYDEEIKCHLDDSNNQPQNLVVCSVSSNYSIPSLLINVGKKNSEINSESLNLDSSNTESYKKLCEKIIVDIKNDYQTIEDRLKELEKTEESIHKEKLKLNFKKQRLDNEINLLRKELSN